jgi:hypothetical protein
MQCAWGEGSLLGADLQSCWYPDVEYADVDSSNEDRSANHDPLRSPSIRYNNTNTVDDDLQ